MIGAEQKASNGLEFYTIKQLQSIGYTVKDTDEADTIICNLLIALKGTRERLFATEEQLKTAEIQLKRKQLSDETLNNLVSILPKQYDLETLKLQRDNNSLDIDAIICSQCNVINKMVGLLIDCRKEISAAQKKKKSLVKHASMNERDQKVIDLYNIGHTQTDIAEALGVSRATVYNIIKKYRNKK